MLADYCSMCRDQKTPSPQQNSTRLGMLHPNGEAVGRAEQQRQKIHAYLTTPIIDSRGVRVTGMGLELVRQLMHAGFDEYFANGGGGGSIELTTEDMSNVKKAIEFLRVQEAEAEPEENNGRAGEGVLKFIRF